MAVDSGRHNPLSRSRVLSLADYFDRVAVINLDRRADRWARLRDHLHEIDWPFREPERVAAVDGDATTVPVWWKQGGGAWGCLMSHARILEDAIRAGHRRVLILEDDVVFVPDLRDRAEAFLASVPSDWDQLYLGGQHLQHPRQVNAEVYRCRNVNRTHAHAVASHFMPRMYRYVLNARDYIDFAGHHIDHRLGALHETGTVRVYAPIEWLAGQVEGQSDISGRDNRTYFWNTWAAVAKMPLVVVLGVHHGRANEVAGLLMDHLSVHFGHNLGGAVVPLAEDAGLADICERVFPFPRRRRKLRSRDSCAPLHDWCRLILQEAADYGTMGGACYPHLCAMHEDFSRAWPQFKVVNVACPLEEATGRLIQRVETETGWLSISRDEAVAVQRFLDRRRARWLKRSEHITVDAAQLDRDPVALADTLSDFLGTSPKPGSG